jgi:hypothetical protein
VPKVVLVCHPFAMLRAGSEAKPKDLANEKGILRCAQNDSFAVILGTLGTSNFRHLTFSLVYLYL